MMPPTNALCFLPASSRPPSFILSSTCRAVETAREDERRQREGAAYRTPEQRAAEARAAKSAHGAEGEEEARVLEKRFDPQRDYYALLCIPRWVGGHGTMCIPWACPRVVAPALDRALVHWLGLLYPSPQQQPACPAAACRSASAAEVRKAYKRLALLSHPDKFKDAAAEEQAAVADKFKLVRGLLGAPRPHAWCHEEWVKLLNEAREFKRGETKQNALAGSVREARADCFSRRSGRRREVFVWAKQLHCKAPCMPKLAVGCAWLSARPKQACY